MPSKKKKGQKQEVKATYSVEELCAKAEELIEQLQPELAEKFYSRALELEPENTRIIDDFATLLLEMDEFIRAKELLLKSVKLAPEENHAKYMQLGQLAEGKEAIDFYKLGIKVLISQQQSLVKHKGDPEEIRFLGEEIAAAFCSAAEIFLTDECFAENAEQECQVCLDEALKYSPNNPEVYQTLASLRISQQKNDDALLFLRKGYSFWRDAEYEEMPSYEFRHNSAKLFLELGDAHTAAEIWEGLLEEDDNIAEVHYHLGLAYSEFDTQLALECLQHAKELLSQTGCEDPELSKLVEEVFMKVKEKHVPEDEELEEEKSEESEEGDEEKEDNGKEETMDTT